MTLECINAIIAEHGDGAVVSLFFDNEQRTTYEIAKKDFLSNIKKMGDSYCIVLKSHIKNNKTGKYDIPVVTYKPLDDIQGITCLDNSEDRKNIDFGDLYA